MCEHGLYLASLIGAVLCLGLIDYRWKLALFYRPKMAGLALCSGVLFFVLWDVSGIALHIFYSGHSRFMTNWYLGPNFPVEELCFLLLLNYLPLLAYEYWSRDRRV